MVITTCYSIIGRGASSVTSNKLTDPSNIGDYASRATREVEQRFTMNKLTEKAAYAKAREVS